MDSHHRCPPVGPSWALGLPVLLSQAEEKVPGNCMRGDLRCPLQGWVWGCHPQAGLKSDFIGFEGPLYGLSRGWIEADELHPFWFKNRSPLFAWLIGGGGWGFTAVGLNCFLVKICCNASQMTRSPQFTTTVIKGATPNFKTLNCSH